MVAIPVLNENTLTSMAAEEVGIWDQILDIFQ